MRIGHGYDVHRLQSGRKLIIGGVEIPYELGLLGHSDADVLLHALMDAMLGAVGLRDIGYYFPDSDATFKGADSIELLKRVNGLIQKQGYRLGNADVTIIAQAPRISPYIEQMRENLANALGVEKGSISVKATTTERLGFTGRKEGIAAQAVVLLTV